jgi:tetratricopeptide (TPR) repeat protein
MFLSRRVYQGSSGRVYPIPFVDRIATEATPREWQAVHLENRWLRLMVLPELGGRIQVGFDKSAQYDFFYRNTVIKPALVGLAGPWVSGGVEFNWPQHHRPATFLPVDVQIEEHADGAVTVWCSDHDPFTRMKGMHGVRLHPDRAVVELVVRLHNRTSEEQSFLWWANVAARVHDDYQSFFPTDVEFVADHARRAITRFPAADRPYYGVDYPSRGPGADRLDFYRNIPVPTSYMILDTADDFFGGYDHAAQAGFVHVADRRIAPGKKQWTWGDAPFGHAWDDLLTDSDGPYIELMAGVYTDNQPDFSWLAPGETKSFTQAWYPIQQIGVVHQANLECAVHFEAGEGAARIGVAVTAERDAATVVLRDRASGEMLYSWAGVLAPGLPHVASVAIGDRPAHLLELEVTDAATLLLRWCPRPRVVSANEPEPATEPPRPAEMASVDELFLTGLHLMQYRHPTRSPLPYWREALDRDPGDARCNLALADHHYRDGNLVLAREHAERALARLTRRNANPRDGEVSYLLGLILRRLGEFDAAYDHFAKSAWDAKWSHPAHVELARLDASSGRDLRALQHVREALATGAEDSRATAIEVVVLRRLGQTDEASARLAARLATDPLDQLARALAGDPLGGDPRTLIDIALELASFGEGEHALLLLDRVAVGPALLMALYHRAAILDRLGRSEDAARARCDARMADPALSFPHGLDDQAALEKAITADPGDLRAHALVGMLLADRDREHDALAHWLAAIDGGLNDPVVLRNAAIATYNLSGDFAAAGALFERAIEAAPTDARLWYESDQLLAIAGSTPEHRFGRLAGQTPTVLTRDDLTIEWCDLLTAVGRAEEALDVLTTRRFAPWEGGEGRALAAWDAATLALAERALAAGRAADALELADRALGAPRSLGEARHPQAPTDHIEGVRARALERLGRASDAAAARSSAIPSPVASSGSEPDYFATSLPELLLFDWPRSPLRG